MPENILCSMKKNYTLFLLICTYIISYSLLGNAVMASEVLSLDGLNNPYFTQDSSFLSNDESEMVQDTSLSEDKVPDHDTLLVFINKYDVWKHFKKPVPMDQLKYPMRILDVQPIHPFEMPWVFDVNLKNNHFSKELTPFYKRKKRIISKVSDSIQTNLTRIINLRSLNYFIVRKSMVQNFQLVQFDRTKLPATSNLVYQIENTQPVIVINNKLSTPKLNVQFLPEIQKVSPWTIKGNSKLQFTQTYVSKNWSKGGESNMSGLSQVNFQANYSKNKNLQFENSIDLKIGLNTVSNDSLRNINVSTDQFRAVSKLGLRMFNDWYYSLSSEFSTQILNNYKANTYNLKSSFLSPAKLFVGLGVDYKKKNSKKGYNLSVLLTPLTMKMNYLRDIEHFSPKSFGIDPGEHLGLELGGKLTANFSWKLTEQLKWTSKYYYYTDFEYVDTDFENTFDLAINNYFSVSLYLHFKLDDRLKRDPGEPLLQTQELFSFGMMYRW